MFFARFSRRSFAITLAALTSATAALTHGSNHTTRCGGIVAPEIPGAEIIAFSTTERYNMSGFGLNYTAAEFQPVSGINVCEVKVELRRPGAGHGVGFQIWLPLKGWNGRFLGNGGGGFQAGYPDTAGLYHADQGFAAGVTDGGKIADTTDIFLDEMLTDGVVDKGRLADFSFRALHDLAIIGKAVTESFYGVKPHHSYWHGCSQGGRQGYILAQRYPRDFDGILSIAPVLYLPEALIGTGWGQLTQRRLKHNVPACVYNAFTQASVKACDGLDGVIDDVVSNIDACKFDPFSLVGQTAFCEGNTTKKVSSEDAEVMSIIMDGPRSSAGTQLYPGWPWGMNFTETTLPTAQTLWDSWLQVMINKDPEYDVSTYTTLKQFSDFLAVSQSEYNGLLGTDNPDLTSFRDNGGKLLSWHGLADQLLPAATTIRYREEVEALMGGNSQVNDFYRLFLPPGIAHCIGGHGPWPSDSLSSLIRWVEEDMAPEALHGPAGTWRSKPRTRIICPYPWVDRYDGKGDPDDSGSYFCDKEYADPV
ncbi:putative feruloyl esterase [Paramyrothecium foliicola]|nr:putative feruloyl esterase [Paramyrothecium foliicola]